MSENISHHTLNNNIAQDNTSVIETIALHSDQRTKLSLILLRKKCYSSCLHLLYDDLLIVSTTGECKSIKDLQPQINFSYCPTITVISNPSSISKFFKVINRKKFNYNSSRKLINLIQKLNLLEVQPGAMVYFTKLSYEHEPVYDLKFFKDYEVNCEKFCNSSIPSFIMNGLMAMIFDLSDSCHSLNLPSCFFRKVSKVISNSIYFDNFNHFLKRVSRKASDSIRFEACYDLLLNNITSLTISFSDFPTLMEVFKHCDSMLLKHLTLTHLTCTKDLRNGNISRNQDLKYIQINERFNDIDRFFHNPNTIEIFNGLESLELCLHNGMNRLILKKFFFSLYQSVITLNKQATISGNKNGKLKLKNFKISETLSNCYGLRQPNANNICNLNKLHKRDVHEYSSAQVIPDLLSIANSFTLFDLFDFKVMSTFEINMKCFFHELNQELYQELYLTPFWNKIKKARTIQNKSMTITLLLEHYDRVHNEHLTIKYATIPSKVYELKRFNRTSRL